MSVTYKTYACDYPGCIASITVSASTLLVDHNWEYRCFTNSRPIKHVCPAHRATQSNELEQLITNERQKQNRQAQRQER